MTPKETTNEVAEGGTASRPMARYLSPLDVWAVGLGVMVGWGAFVMPGTTFLPIAGPAGTVIALVLCTVIILVIGKNFAYLMNRLPGTGGVYSYTKKAFGRDHAFICSWFFCLSYLTIVFLNATALFVIMRTMFGSFWQVGLHYQVAGYDVYLGEIGLSATLLVVTALLFVLGKPFLQKLQTALGLVLMAGVLVITVAVLPHLDLTRLTEFSGGGAFDSLGGIALIVVLAPWAFVGFDVVSLETAHFKFSTAKSWRVIAIAILCAGFAYLALSLVAVSYHPVSSGSWQRYVANLDDYSGVDAVPTFFAAKSAMGPAGVVVAAVAAFAAILTGVLGASRAMIRMLSTMAEDKIISREFLGTAFCTVFVMGLSIGVSFLGRNALEWFVELTSFGAIVGFGYASAAAAKFARADGDRSAYATGCIGLAIAVVFVLAQLVSRIGPVETMGAPSFLLLAVWCLLGFVFYWRTMRQSGLAEFSGVTISSIVLFCLLFYSALMWFVKTLNGHADSAELQDVVRSSAIVFALVSAVGLAAMLYVQAMLRTRLQGLEREKIRAEEGSRAKSQFLFNMSHDLRTPMNAVIGYTHLAQQEDGVPPKVGDYLEKIDSAGSNLLSLVNDILEMSRIENDDMELAPFDVDLRNVLADVEDLFSIEMAEKGLEFSVDTIGVENSFVVCDGNRLERVLQNLLSNASKFTPEGGHVTVTLEQLPDAEDGRASFALRVKDTGMGMSPEFVDKLFVAFERERTSTASGLHGTGLGMAITKSIVDKMGGTIDVDTEIGRGTEFTIRLSFDYAARNGLAGDDGSEAAAPAGGLAPAARVALEASPVEAGDGQGGGQDGAAQVQRLALLKVLVVDDNMVNREIITMILEGWGVQVSTAENGRVAVDAVAAQEAPGFDVVFMDIQMPVMDGYEATRAIRSLPDPKRASVPIVAVTANAFEEDERNAFDVGMNGHIAKPIDPDKMRSALLEAVKVPS